MAVFTDLSLSDVQSILSNYQLGQALRLSPIAQGIENTNYFLDTQRLVRAAELEHLAKRPQRHGSSGHDEDGDRWVLTIFENLACDELPFFCALTSHLYQDGLCVPAPLAAVDGQAVFKFKGKSGLIVPKFEGSYESNPDITHCELIGVWLACMHRSLSSFRQTRALVRNLKWMQTSQQQLTSSLNQDDSIRLTRAIERYKEYSALLDACPKGIVHGDMFRDNVLFDEGQISGVLDFYNACEDVLLYDLAVCVNDWCVDENGCYQDDKCQAMVLAYQRVRPFEAAEKQVWHYTLELAALRFWLSRMLSKHGQGYQDSALSGMAIKDPDEMKRIMLNAQEIAQD